MNEHDKKLVEWAKSLPYTDWFEIDENKAETPEGKEELHRIASHKYHIEEYYAGIL